MTYREKKAFLAGYIVAQKNIESAMSEVEWWETWGSKVNQALKMGPGGSGSSATGGRVEKAAVEIASILEKIRQELKEIEEERDKVLNAINTKCRRSRQRDLLYMRYIRRMSNERIACVIGKDVKTVQKVIRQAIMDLDI